ncbi:hypothetical protein [Pseudomonas sp.]|uniref:hypothetical protein n=1 Tax=Pseudomonas sp. TaxID=306 RepID=UPI0027300D24|nr:hypothetical protein [Pseudomonas sp.]MDP2244331.1 hypothetical protein [Pseudomonas sp.]
MSIFALSSHDVKLLSHILHSTSKAIGRPSKLAPQREMLSKLLGFRDWNIACAILPDRLSDTIHVAIALLEAPSAAPKLLMTSGIDAPWRLPEKVRDHLVNQSQDPTGFTVSSCTRPDPVGDVKLQHWSYELAPGLGRVTEHKVAFGPHEIDYGRSNHTPTVMTFANARGQDAFTVTVWSITLHPESRKATNFTGAASMPFYNTFIESITGHAPEHRQAYCLVNSRQNGFANAIVRCNERGSELEIVEHLHYMKIEEAWAKLAPYNKALGLSLLDVADITWACSATDDEDIADTW